MLPIKSPFDTFRAGVWVAKRNVAIILVYVVLMTAHFFYVDVLSESTMESMGAGGSFIGSIVSLVLQFLISALLIFPLHATFLSDGRVAGFAAIRGFGGLCRIAWRSFLIFIAAMVPTGIIFAIGAPILGGGMAEFGAASEAAQAGDVAAGKLLTTYMVAMFAIGAPFFGASVILFGLRIPHIVDKGGVKSASSSIRRGTSQFWRMAAFFAAGPGTVFLAQYVIWWGLITFASGRNGPPPCPETAARSWRRSGRARKRCRSHHPTRSRRGNCPS